MKDGHPMEFLTSNSVDCKSSLDTDMCSVQSINKIRKLHCPIWEFSGSHVNKKCLEVKMFGLGNGRACLSSDKK